MEIKPLPSSSDREALPLVSLAACRGILVGFDESGKALVDYQNNQTGRPIGAPAVIAIGRNDLGRPVLLVFEDGDANRPIIIGLITPSTVEAVSLSVQVSADGKRVAVTAEDEIVLRCGASSITLTKAGKVLIRGTHVLSRSSGANRIKGGSVEIN